MQKTFDRISKLLEGEYIFRFADTRIRRNIIINKDVKESTIRRYRGVGIECYYKGGVGFSSTSSITFDGILECAINALNTAKLNVMEEEFIYKGTIRSRIIRNINLPKSKDTYDLYDIIKKSKEIDNYVIQNTRGIDSIYISHSNIITKKLIFKTSNNSCLMNEDEFNSMMINYHIIKNGKIERIADVFQERGSWKSFLEKVDIKRHALELAISLIDKVENGVEVPKGVHTVILGPKVVGTLVHEAIGHCAEADFVRSGSIAKIMLNKRVGMLGINIKDVGYTKLVKEPPINLQFDDEGNHCKDVNIIENGILRSFLHSNGTAREFHCDSTGNARAFLYNDNTLVRMRNTFLLPGSTELVDLFKSVKDGYYLKRIYNGQSDINCEFNFTVIEGYKIKNGELTAPLKDCIITGQGFDVFKSVKLIGNDFEWSAALCNKEQIAMVGQGGPSILTEIMLGSV